MPILEVQNIKRHFINGQVRTDVLKGIDLSVDSGNYISIMGPSGSGKSTLLNLLGCLDRPSSGCYILNGEPVEKLSDNSLADIRNRYIGFVFQTFHLLPNLSARGNVELPLIYRGVPKRDRIKQAEEALDMVGLSERKHHLPKQMSGGEQQRVAIARAIVGKPEILLADEPTGALDSRNRVKIMEIFSWLNQELGLTIIQVTHDQEVSYYGSRVLHMADGEIIREELVSDEIRLGKNAPKPVLDEEAAVEDQKSKKNPEGHKDQGTKTSENIEEAGKES